MDSIDVYNYLHQINLSNDCYIYAELVSSPSTHNRDVIIKVTKNNLNVIINSIEKGLIHPLSFYDNACIYNNGDLIEERSIGNTVDFVLHREFIDTDESLLITLKDLKLL